VRPRQWALRAGANPGDKANRWSKTVFSTNRRLIHSLCTGARVSFHSQASYPACARKWPEALSKSWKAVRRTGEGNLKRDRAPEELSPRNPRGDPGPLDRLLGQRTTRRRGNLEPASARRHLRRRSARTWVRGRGSGQLGRRPLSRFWDRSLSSNPSPRGGKPAIAARAPGSLADGQSAVTGSTLADARRGPLAPLQGRLNGIWSASPHSHPARPGEIRDPGSPIRQPDATSRPPRRLSLSDAPL
jgi:hypothetical protein